MLSQKDLRVVRSWIRTCSLSGFGNIRPISGHSFRGRRVPLSCWNRRHRHRYVDVRYMHWSFMRLKRLDLGTALVAGLLAAAPVAAQSGGKFSLPAQGTTRQGVEARPPQTVVIDPYSRYQN